MRNQKALSIRILLAYSAIALRLAGLKRATDAGIQSAAINFAGFAERTDFDRELARALEALQPDLVVLAGYMRILPADTVNTYAGRMLNVHPSLLPAYPGLNTYQRAIDAGERYHGSTVHYVIPELDAGPPVLQYRVSIRPNETADELSHRVQAGGTSDLSAGGGLDCRRPLKL